MTGRLEESLAIVRKGAEIDPLSPLVTMPVSGHLLFLRRYDEAIAEASKLLRLFPDQRAALGVIQIALWLKGSYEEALAEYRKSMTADLMEIMEAGYKQAGPRGAMRAVAESLATRTKPPYPGALSIAQSYALAGEIDPAFVWL